jgi:hypothetical protein
VTSPAPRGRRLTAALQGFLPRESRMLFALLTLNAAVGVLIWQAPEVMPLAALLVPLALANLLLGPRQLPFFVLVTLLVLAVAVAFQSAITGRIFISALIVAGLCIGVVLSSFHRSRLGVAGLRGELMLVDLRDRILRQGGIPGLPGSWHVESELRSAGGTPFAGDFVVAIRKGNRLEVAVVDVSGKGEAAGTRALLLSGALGGLLGALAPEDFLEAANDFLIRQDWDEGFASAVHLSLELETGRFQIRSAGHPPAALRAAGSGRWSVITAEGPLLGLIDEAAYEPAAGIMRSGDALLLYTDGMVETRTRDISLGVDKMLGQAEQLLRGEYVGGATRIIESIGSRKDDRALLLVHRR